MSRRLKQAAVVATALLALAQLAQPARENPRVDPDHAIRAWTSSELGEVLDRGCRDCHTNATVWPWYARIAPVSWLMAYGVRAGRRAVNFSEWDRYSSEQQHALLVASCHDVTEGTMPGAYSVLHPETRLAARDVATICAASAEPQAAPTRAP